MFWYSVILPVAVVYLLPSLLIGLAVAKGFNGQLLAVVVVPLLSLLGTWILMWKLTGASTDGWERMVVLFLFVGLSPTILAVVQQWLHLDAVLSLAGLGLLIMPAVLLTVGVLTFH